MSKSKTSTTQKQQAQYQGQQQSQSQAQQNQAFNTSTAKTAPAWLAGGVEGLWDKISGLGDADPTSFVPGASDLQDQAFSRASGLFGGADPFESARASWGNIKNVDKNSILEGFERYLNPATSSLVDTGMADFDENAARQRAQMAAQGAGGTQAFGGSRWGVAQGSLEGELARARASTNAGLRSTAFGQAADLANADATRSLQSDLANQMASIQSAQAAGQIAQQSAAQNNQNIGLLANLGGVQQGINTNVAQAPLAVLQAQTGLLNDLPIDPLTGQVISGTSSGMSSEMGLENTSGTSSGSGTGTNKTSGIDLGSVLFGTPWG